MHKPRLVRRGIPGMPGDIWVMTTSLRDRGTRLRISPDDESLVGRNLSQGRPKQLDGSVLIPVEKR